MLSHISLRPFTTFGIEARADWFCAAHTWEEAREALLFARERDLPVLILGGGSNLLFTRDFPGLVLQVACRGISVLEEDAESVWIRVKAGEPWHPFVLHCLQQGWYGLENLSLIPGTVGAAPMQNIGAYGVEIKEVLQGVHYFNRQFLEPAFLPGAACEFGYRESVFKHQLRDIALIWEVDFRLSKVPAVRTGYGDVARVLADKGIDHPHPRDVSEAVVAIRSSKLPDPAQLGNAGSFFKNPVVETPLFEEIQQRYPDIPSYPAGPGQTKVPAGWLIEQAGWKGHHRGTHGVHARQALVLVNYGGATGSQILDLARDIQADVEQKFGIRLQMEVNVV